MEFNSNLNVPPERHVMTLGGQGWIGLVNSMGSEVTIVNAARVSFGKMKSEMDDGDAKLLKYLIDHQHTTPMEHVCFTFLIHCPLFVRSQWHRHRTWSYNEISRRYTESDVELYVPVEIRKQSENNRQASVKSDDLDQDACISMVRKANEEAFKAYEELLRNGVCREQARGVLPQNMMTTFWATVDLNNLNKFLVLRDSDHAQSEIREYAAAIKKLIAPDFPNLARICGW